VRQIRRMKHPLLILAIFHTIYYLLTGVWPLVHIRSFLAVTGAKTDLWLVRTVGLLVTAIGVAIGVGALRNELTMPLVVLSVGTAAGLCAIDVIYTVRRVISPIYLADAVAEVALIVAWLILWTIR
jgi:hypothetical protein